MNKKDSKGYAPLHYAAMHDNYGAALILLNHIDTFKEVRFSKPTIIIQNYFKFNIIVFIIKITDNLHGMTALHIAGKYASEHVAALLIERLSVPKLTLADNNKMLALHHVCKCKLERPSVVRRMLKRLMLFLSEAALIDVLNTKDRFENTLFDLAIKENHLKIVEILLRINPMYKSICDHELNLPIHITARFNSTQQTLQLLERFDCISFEPNKNWDNVFHLAASTNKLELIKELVNKYSVIVDLTRPLNAFNSDRLTPLLCAIAKGNIECADYLFGIVVNVQFFTFRLKKLA